MNWYTKFALSGSGHFDPTFDQHQIRMCRVRSGWKIMDHLINGLDTNWSPNLGPHASTRPKWPEPTRPNPSFPMYGEEYANMKTLSISMCGPPECKCLKGRFPCGLSLSLSISIYNINGPPESMARSSQINTDPKFTISGLVPIEKITQ